MNKKVVIVQRTVKFYRTKFFELLKDKCDQNNIELTLIYGEDEVLSFNDADVSWGVKVKNYQIAFLGKKLYYQNIWKYLKKTDLIIVEQANKHLVNYILWILNLFKIKKLAFWGHGRNFQNNGKLLSRIYEWVKKQLTNHVSWFFAYTELSRKILAQNGFPSKKITVINNTIPLEELRNEIEKCDVLGLQNIRKQIGVNSSNVCIYIGGMYKEKKLSFLLQAIEIVKKHINNFEIIFIGDGPEKELITQFVEKNNWAYYFGVKGEKEKAPYLYISKLLLMPGIVGLVVIDSFIFGLPLITTECKGHGPEISYIENGVNGLIISDHLDKYASAIIRLLQNDEEREILKHGCVHSAEKYSMNSMVNKFYEGIFRSLNEK